MLTRQGGQDLWQYSCPAVYSSGLTIKQLMDYGDEFLEVLSEVGKEEGE